MNNLQKLARIEKVKDMRILIQKLIGVELELDNTLPYYEKQEDFLIEATKEDGLVVAMKKQFYAIYQAVCKMETLNSKDRKMKDIISIFWILIMIEDLDYLYTELNKAFPQYNL